MGGLAVLLESNQAVTGQILQLLRKRFSELVEGHEVTVEVMDCLPLISSGKHRSIISERVERIWDKN